MADNHPIFVISDLHMGDDGPRDNFPIGDREKQLGLFLDYVANQNGELIILGDLFEFWQMNISKSIVLHKPLMDRLAAMNATYVLGNHDADFDHFIGDNSLSHPLFQRMCGPFERQIGGKRFKFMHGHEIDPVNNGDEPKWGRVCCIVAGMAEDRNGSPIDDKGGFVEDDLEAVGLHFEEMFGGLVWLLGKIKRFFGLGGLLRLAKQHLTPAQNPDRAKELLLLYKQDRDANDYDVLIAGHTHQPGRIGDWYFNSGTWARKTNSFVQINPNGYAIVCDWVDGQPVTNATVLQM